MFFVVAMIVTRVLNHAPSLKPQQSSNDRARELLDKVVVSSDAKEKIEFYINQNRIIDAIKELRLATGLDLRDSKTIIDELIATKDIHRLRTGAGGGNLIAEAIKSAVEKPAELSEQAQHDIEDLVRRGQLIDAIKEYREATGADLMTSKNYVEALKSKLG